MLIVDDQSYTYYGVFLRGDDPKEMIHMLAEDLVKWGSGISGGIFMVIEAPCGHKVEYRTPDDVPIVDTPCTCGNPKHWFIKIERMI